MRQNKYSDQKIVWFPDKLASFRDGTITAPIYVRVKPTNRCNHSCDWCAYGHGSWESKMHEDMNTRDMIPRAKLLETLWDFHDMGVKAVTFSGGGEPLSYPYITEAMRLMLSYGIDLSIITNASLLEKERAEVLNEARWVRASIDYTSAAQMAASRNIAEDQFPRIMNNIGDFARTKKPDCDLGVNYIVTRDNYDGLAQFCLRLKEIGVGNVRISPVWRPDFAWYHNAIESVVRAEIEMAQKLNDANFTVYSSYNLNSSAHRSERNYHKCYFTQMVPVVAADQIVYHCHNTAYAEHGVIGSIKDRSFKDLWFSDEAKEAFARLNPSHVCRHQCAADGKNKLIADLLEASGDNFV